MLMSFQPTRMVTSCKRLIQEKWMRYPSPAGKNHHGRSSPAAAGD
jgi:hypothetical protein